MCTGPRLSSEAAEKQPLVPALPALSGEGSSVSPATARILFGQAYYLRFDPKLWAASQPYPPLGTLYAAAYLRHHGYDVALFDAMLAESEADWAAALDRERPALAVLYEDNFNYLSKMCLLRMRTAALQMIAAARARHIPVIVAGSDATDHPSVYLDAGARCVLLGEGEVTLKEVVGCLMSSCATSLEEIRGVCFRDADGGSRRTPAREPIRDLESLPRPAWDLVDVGRYRDIWRSRHAYHSMNLVTTRGCPYKCNWCAKPIYGQRYTVRQPEAVVDEIAWLKDTYQPDHLWVADDIFGLQPGWVERFAELVVARDAVVPFKCLMRADEVGASVVKALRSAGCRTVWIGAESGSQRILNAMDKGVRVPQITAAAAHLHAAGIQVGLFLQFGYPGETREDIERTLQMVRTCRPTTSACPCPIRCRGRVSTIACAPSSAKSRTGSTRAIFRRCITRLMGLSSTGCSTRPSTRNSGFEGHRRTHRRSTVPGRSGPGICGTRARRYSTA